MLSIMGYENISIETECSAVGSKLAIKMDPETSNGKYVTSTPETKTGTVSPIEESTFLQLKISVPKTDNYCLFGRFNNSSPENNSLWMKIDNEKFELVNDLKTNGWEWKLIKNYKLKAGKHTITLAFSENGGAIDKISLKNSTILPTGLGEEAVKECVTK
jgi:hypothetical protein